MVEEKRASRELHAFGFAFSGGECAAVVVVVVTGGGTTEPLCRGLSTALSILLAGVRWELRVETASSAEGSSAAVAPPEAGPGRLAPGW